MKYKIAITPSSFAQTSKKPMELLSNKFKQISLNTYGRRLSKAETLEILNECDGVIAGLEKYDEEVFSQCPKLKVISRVGIGIDNIDLNAAEKHTSHPTASRGVCGQVLGLVKFAKFKFAVPVYSVVFFNPFQYIYMCLSTLRDIRV